MSYCAERLVQSIRQWWRGESVEEGAADERGHDAIVIMAAEVEVIKARHRQLRHDDAVQRTTTWLGDDDKRP